ncbi:MAG: LamG-like jellyroll fold domain-containing protein, partial [Fermentimonas sp.]
MCFAGCAAGAINETGLIAHFDFEGDFNSSDDSIVGEYVIDAAAYYPFNGNAVDESENDNNGTVYGATLTEDHLGNANNAYNFTGPGDYINCGNGISYGNKSATYAFWMKLNDLADTRYQYIFSVNDGSVGSISLQLERGRNLRALVTTSVMPYAHQITDEEWHHYAFVYNYEELKFLYYVDGDLVYTDTEIEFPASLDSSPDFRISGRWGSSSTDFDLNGAISEFSVYDKILSGNQIKNIYEYSSTHKLTDPFIDGYYGKSLNFNGVCNYVSLGNLGITDRTNVTYIATINLNELLINYTSPIYGGAIGTDNSFWALKNPFSALYPFKLYARQDDIMIVGNTDISPAPTCVAYTFNYDYTTSKLKLYVNSQLDASVTRSGFDVFPPADQYIGYDSRSLGYFGGDISDMWIFNRTLSENEILNFYNYPIFPSNNTAISVTYPPLTNEITLRWNKIPGVSKYKLEIAKDPQFYTIVKLQEIDTNYSTVNLEDDKYYWRVTPYFVESGSYGLVSDVFNFEFDPTTVEYETPSIQGTVYQTVEDTPAGVANVNIYITNGTWSSNFITSSTGYYFFTDVVIGSIYQVYATKEEYTDSSVYYVNATGNVTVQDIAINPIEGEGQ